VIRWGRGGGVGDKVEGCDPAAVCRKGEGYEEMQELKVI